MANYERSAVLIWQAFLCRKLGWAANPIQASLLADYAMTGKFEQTLQRWRN
jgi:hypothetical protein